MRTLILLAIVWTLAPARSALAQGEEPRWQLLGANRESVGHLDMARVREVSAGVYGAWVRWTMAGGAQSGAGIRFDTILHRSEYDCTELRSRRLQEVYLLDGRVVRDETPRDAVRWEYSLPESEGERLVLQACSLVQGRLEGDGASPPGG